jgi:hypothetical protein
VLEMGHDGLPLMVLATKLGFLEASKALPYSLDSVVLGIDVEKLNYNTPYTAFEVGKQETTVGVYELYSVLDKPVMSSSLHRVLCLMKSRDDGNDRGKKRCH